MFKKTTIKSFLRHSNNKNRILLEITKLETFLESFKFSATPHLDLSKEIELKEIKLRRLKRKLTPLKKNEKKQRFHLFSYVSIFRNGFGANVFSCRE